MEENWEIYPCLIEDEIALIAVDLAKLEGAPRATHPVRLEVRVPLRAPDEDGLVDEDEMGELLGIEQGLFNHLSEACAAIPLGHVTTQAERVWYFQVGEAAGFDEAVATGLAQAAEYEPEISAVEDSEWELYRGLLVPEPLEFQSIQNRRMCAALLEHGDTLQLPRLVTHWAFFGSETARESFQSELVVQGFATELDATPEEEDGSPFVPTPGEEYCLRFEREDRVDVTAVDELVLPLFELAETHGGRYEGWETTVEGAEG